MLITRDEFYRRRDDRTRRLAGGSDYHDVPVGIVASQAVATSAVGQIMIIIVTNLMSRWCRVVDLAIPDVDLVSQCRTTRAPSLRSRIVKEMRDADPFGDFGFRDPRPRAVTLSIGPGSGSVIAPDFSVWVDGWDALGWRPSQDAPCISGTPVGFQPAAALAACLGVAAVFKMAVGHSRADQLAAFRWSLWNHCRSGIASSSPVVVSPPDLTSVTLGRLLQIGVGAVGSNVLYLLDLLGVHGRILTVDHDHVEIENLDRSLLFTVSDAIPGAKKVESAASRLRASTLKVDRFVGTWNDLVKTGRNLHEFDLWIPLANEEDVRRSMASNLPPTMIHGSTSTDWAFFLGRHIPFREYCLGCRFPGSYVSDSDLLCSTGAVDVTAPEHPSQQVDASLPFLSAAAASLVVAELLKLTLSGYHRMPNYVEADLRGAMRHPLVLGRQCRSDCRTADQNGTMWQAWFTLIESSRYAHHWQS